MWLSDRSIRRLVAEGRMGIDPFDGRLVQPASVDCLLGGSLLQMAPGLAADPRKPDDVRWHSVRATEEKPFRLERDAFVLGHTVETYRFPPNLLGFVHGKSSLARLGLAVHVTAGLCDPGFYGQVTLELSNMGRRDILLWPSMPIAQMAFAFLDLDAERPYGAPGLGSKYNGQLGPTAPRLSGIPHALARDR